MQSGTYFYYQLLPSGSQLEFLDSLTIRLESVLGDAELLVSTTRPLPRIDDLASNDSTTMISR
jgi:hypothetical protein